MDDRQREWVLGASSFCEWSGSDLNRQGIKGSPTTFGAYAYLGISIPVGGASCIVLNETIST